VLAPEQGFFNKIDVNRTLRIAAREHWNWGIPVAGDLYLQNVAGTQLMKVAALDTPHARLKRDSPTGI
jgi:hypothetical protein